MKIKKVNAFTLTEMLVVIVVASLVISMTFLVLSMVRKQVIGIQNSYQNQQQVHFFETALLRDLNNYNVSYIPTKKQLLLERSKDSIAYRFYSDYVLRGKDTLWVAIKNKKLFLDGTEVEKNNVNALEIEFTEVYGNKKIFVFSTNDASYYVNNLWLSN